MSLTGLDDVMNVSIIYLSLSNLQGAKWKSVGEEVIVSWLMMFCYCSFPVYISYRKTFAEDEHWTSYRKTFAEDEQVSSKLV